MISRGIGREAKRRAMQECFGVTGDLDNHVFGGKTDWGILADLLAPFGRSAADIGRDMPAYEAVMARHMRQISGDYLAEPCPHAMELVQALRGRDDTLIGLVTGNTSRTAAIKLEMAGYAPDWFVIGAFGNESPDRDDSDAAGAAASGRAVWGARLTAPSSSSSAIRPRISRRRAPSTRSRSPFARVTPGATSSSAAIRISCWPI